jgi:hypothetical protein
VVLGVDVQRNRQLPCRFSQIAIYELKKAETDAEEKHAFEQFHGRNDLQAARAFALIILLGWIFGHRE